MLQFIACENDNYSIPEQVQMALEGGCKWVQFFVPGFDDSQIREVAREIIPLCKENNAMLTLVDHVELAKELSIHGVLLIDSKMSPAEAREFCGPEAIVGVGIHRPEDLIPLADADIDFATFPLNLPLDIMAAYVSAIRDGDVMLPLVAFGNYPLAILGDVLATGVNGLALGASITDTIDPVDTVKQILEFIKKDKIKI